MNEVSCRVTRHLITFSDSLGYAPETLIALAVARGARREEARLELLMDTRRRVSWETFAILNDVATELWGSEEAERAFAVDELKRKDSHAAPLVSFARVLATPTMLYRIGFKHIGRANFCTVDSTFEELPDGRLRLEVRLGPGMRHTDSFFRICRQMYTVTPHILGLPDAKVELDISPGVGRYLVTPPVCGNRVMKVWDTIKLRLFLPKALDQLINQEAELIASLDELTAERAKLERQVQERTEELQKANASLARAEKDLGHARKERHLTETLFRALAESTGHFVWSVDLDGRFRYVNEGAFRMLGYEPGELVGRPFYEIQPPDIAARDRQQFEKAGDGILRSYDYETELLNKSGESVSVLANTMPVNDEHGQLVGFVGISWNVTEHKRLVGALRLSRESLARAQAIAHVGSWEWDMLEDRLSWSEEASRIIGRDANKSPVSLAVALTMIPPEDHDIVYAALARAKEDFKALDIEHRVIRPDGTIRYVHSQGEVVVDDNGEPIRLVGAVHDITIRKAYEDSLLAAKHAADEASRMKSAFLANISHEIRTPMTAVLGFSELLTRNDLSPERRNACSEAIQRNGKHLIALIDDILELSRVEAGRLRIKVERFSPLEEIEHVVGLLLPQAESKNLRIEIDAAPQVARHVDLDPTRFRQILFNIVGNAVKFTNKGGIHISVRMAAAVTPRLQIIVTDTGVGIDEHLRSRIFEPFSRAHDTTTTGFGLGLDLSRRLARMLGGDVELTSSAVGMGSTFTISLPIKYGQTLPSLQGRHIVVAEGDDDLADLIRIHLERAGADVTVVGDGASCLANVDSTSVDALVLDLGLSGIPSDEIAARLRAGGFRAPIIGLSGPTDDFEPVDVSEIVAKPVDGQGLARLISSSLKSTQSLSV